MKKTIIKPDGSSETVEGTPEEIADYERKIRGETQNEAPKPKTPGLLTDELKRLDDALKDFPKYFNERRDHSPDCAITIAQRGWWSVLPPSCTCSLYTLQPFSDPQIGTWSSTSTSRIEGGVIFPGCMGRPAS